MPNLPVYGDRRLDKAYIRRNAARILYVYERLADGYCKALLYELLRFDINGEPIRIAGNWKATVPSRPPIFPIAARILTSARMTAPRSALITQPIPRMAHCWPSSLTCTPSGVSAQRSQTFPAPGRLHAAASDRAGEARFAAGHGRGSALAPSGTPVRTVTVDGLCGRTRLGLSGVLRVGACALTPRGRTDVCSGEAANTLYEDAPALCVAVYHRAFDLIELPRLVLAQLPDYRLTLGKKDYIPAWDVFLFAEKRKKIKISTSNPCAFVL